MIFEIKINDKTIFVNGSADLVETKGNLILFDVSVFAFSSLKAVAYGGEKIAVYRNDVCLFKGNIMRVEEHMENTGLVRFDYYCVDLYQELQDLILWEDREKQFRTVSEWLSFLVEEFNKKSRKLKLSGTIANDLNIELEIKGNWTFAALLNEIKAYDNKLSYFFDYEQGTLIFTYNRGETIKATMWEQIATIREDLDATDYKNTSSAISEWIEEIVHWKTVCEWVSGGKYVGWGNDTSGASQLLMFWSAGFQLAPANINAHADTSSSREITRWYKDWSSIFGVSWGGAHAPYAGHRGIDIYYEDAMVMSPPFPCTIEYFQEDYKGALGCHMAFRPYNDKNKKKEAIIRLSHLKNLYDQTFVSQNIFGYVEPSTVVGEMGGSGFGTNTYYAPHLDVTIWIEGECVDPYPYVFNQHGNGFEGWNEIYADGYLECHQEIDWIEYVPHKLIQSEINTEEVEKYGTIEYSARDNEIREQQVINDIVKQNYTYYQNIGFMRRVELSFIQGLIANLNDYIQVFKVPFMDDGEEAKVIQKDINLLEPYEEEITIDTTGFRYIKSLIAGRR